MNWQSVFFSANGRMGQKDFWVAALILILAWLVSHVLHLLALIAYLVIAYCWICIISKRLHDAGRSGWLNLVPFAMGCGAGIISLVVGGVAAITAFTTGGSHADASSWALLWGSLGMVALVWGVVLLADLIFLLWVGLAASDAGDNRYGPPPSPWIRPAQPPAPAA